MQAQIHISALSLLYQLMKATISKSYIAFWASVTDERRLQIQNAQSAGCRAITRMKRDGCALYTLQTATGNTLTYPGFERELTACEVATILETSEVCFTVCAPLMML